MLMIGGDGRPSWCDLDFFQTEIPFAAFTRDPADARVFVLVTREQSGGGGSKYTLYFTGKRDLVGRADTLMTNVPPAASDDDNRRALKARLAAGLIGLAAQTGLASNIGYTYAAPTGGDAQQTGEGVTTVARDPWRGWVARLSGNGFFQGEQQYRNLNAFGSVSVERTTDAIKTAVRLYGSLNRSGFDVTETVGSPDGSSRDSLYTVTSESRSSGLATFVAFTLNDHWTIGADVEATRSTFSNYALRVQSAPAIEYNVFPWSEATRRQFRFIYAAGAETAFYADTTIFGKKREVLPIHLLAVQVVSAQQWGSMDVGLNLSQYLSKPDKYRAVLGGNMDVRVARGLSVNFGGNFAFVRDQIALPAEGASPEDILTRQRALSTNFEYFGSVGLSYSFGSILNPVVNRRFGYGGPF